MRTRVLKVVAMLAVVAGCAEPTGDESGVRALTDGAKKGERCEGRGDLKKVAAVLDGQKYLVPCGANQPYSDLVCVNQPQPTCPQTDPWITRGAIGRDETVTLGGDPGAVYQVTLRVRGVVEPKHFNGGAPGSPANGTNYGWYVGGTPNAVGDYGTFALGVSSPQQTYYLNAIDHLEQHAAYEIDYTVKVPMAGGAKIRFLQSDPNCSMVRNCDSTSIEGAGGAGQCHPIVIPGLHGVSQPYNGQFVVLDVVKVEA